MLGLVQSDKIFGNSEIGSPLCCTVKDEVGKAGSIHTGGASYTAVRSLGSSGLWGLWTLKNLSRRMTLSDVCVSVCMLMLCFLFPDFKCIS